MHATTRSQDRSSRPSQDQVKPKSRPRCKIQGTQSAIDDREASNSQYQNPIIRCGLDWSLQQWQCAANLTSRLTVFDEKQRWTRGGRVKEPVRSLLAQQL
jgi:hypothetical protein